MADDQRPDDAACICCGEPNDQDGDACSFCVAWGCAGDPNPSLGAVVAERVGELGDTGVAS